MGKTRVEHMLGKHALRTIQADDDSTMYVTVTSAAMYMATAGFLEAANDLLGRLWSYNTPHDGNCWLADRALEVLWHADGNRPPGVPFAPEPIDQIEVAHRVYMAVDRWATPLPTRPWQELDGLDLLRRSMRLACPPTELGPMPNREDESEALMGLDKYLDGVEPLGWIPPMALCLAAEIAGRLGRREQASYFAVRWAEGYATFWANCSFECMACNRYVAPLLLQGILAEPLGLTADSCLRYLEALITAVDERMRHGRTLAYGYWPWRKLLKEISKSALTKEPDQYALEERERRWIGRAAATKDEIAAAEARLQVQLPADYVAFVRVSNGFSPTSSTSPRLVPIAEIDYLRRIADPEDIDIYKEYAGDDMPEAIEKCILVSEKDATEMVLLIPPLTTEQRWQTWFFAPWVPGEERYPSFRHFMEWQLQYLSSCT